MIRIGGNIVESTLMVNTNKRDLRIRSEAVRSAGAVGDILRVELPATAAAGYDYYVEIVPAGTTLHATYLALCVHHVRPPSHKQWGYY